MSMYKLNKNKTNTVLTQKPLLKNNGKSDKNNTKKERKRTKVAGL